MDIPADDLEACLRVLQCVADDPALIASHDRFKSLVAKIHREGKRQQRHQQREQRTQHDRVLVQQTGIVQPASTLALPDPTMSPVHYQQPHSCYICKQAYREVHHHYHLLCPACATLNWGKRTQRADLNGRRALLTGGRIKIGFHTALKLLRDGAEVLLTTRFPHDAAQRFAKEPDAHSWLDRLHIEPLDLRDLFAVEAFTQRLLAAQRPFDLVIHNAAQTIKRPLAFYQHLLEGETQALRRVDERPTLLEARADYAGHLRGWEAYFPVARLDRDGQQVDERPQNSWRSKLGEIDTVELVEVLLVNSIAPFVLDNALLPLLRAAPHARRFIVHVSAMEGQFSRPSKTCHHPHTNMAKAALNMLTRTTAAELAREGIFVNSVDTGWITDERPFPHAEQARAEEGFYVPLDSVDGASRIYDPIATGLHADHEPLHGHFLKDYFPFPW